MIKLPSFPAKFWIIVISEGLMVWGYSLAFPFLAIYLTQYGNINTTVVGFYFFVVMLIASFSSVIGGGLSDNIGRKSVMFYSLFIRGIFVFFISLAIKLNLHPYIIMFLNFLASVGGLGFHSVAQAYISDIVDERDRVGAYSILRVATNAGWAMGPMIGGYLTSFSYSLAFGVSSFVFLIASFVVFFKIDDIKTGKISEKINFFPGKMSIDFKKVLLYSFLMTAVMSQLVVPLSVYSKKYLQFSEKQIGFLFTLNGSIVVFTQYFVGKRIKENKLVTALTISSGLYAFGYLIFGYSHSYFLALFAMIVITTGEIIYSPSVSTLVANLSPSSKRGIYIGFHSMISDFGRAFGVFIGSFLIDKFSEYFQQISWYFVFLIAVVSSFGFASVKYKKVGEIYNKKELRIKEGNVF